MAGESRKAAAHYLLRGGTGRNVPLPLRFGGGFLSVGILTAALALLGVRFDFAFILGLWGYMGWGVIIESLWARPGFRSRYRRIASPSRREK